MAEVAIGSNPHRISFQRYMLPTMLEEVLVATTLRLGVMSRGRYEMRRKTQSTDQRAAGGWTWRFSINTPAPRAR